MGFRTRNPGIDVLRGVSIILVIMLHLAIRIPLSDTALAAVLPNWLISALCSNGFESVIVFFVVSGFLITSNALDRWDSLGNPDFRAFYIRRGARILPCLLVLVAVLSVLDLTHFADYQINRSDQSLPGAVFAALSFRLNWYEAYSGYLPGSWDVLWSLSVEEAFYLAFPFVCLLARVRTTPLLMLLFLFAISLPLARGSIQGNELLREKAYLPGMACIATGVLAAIVAHRWQISRATRTLFIVVGSIGWLLIIFAENPIWRYLGESTMLVLTSGTAMLLVGLHSSARISLPFTAWLQVFGRLSYEIYLTHMFVVFAALKLFHMAGLQNSLGYLLYPLVLAASLVLGWAVAWLLSQPAEQWIRRLLLPASSGRHEGFLSIDGARPKMTHLNDPFT